MKITEMIGALNQQKWYQNEVDQALYFFYLLAVYEIERQHHDKAKEYFYNNVLTKPDAPKDFMEDIVEGFWSERSIQ